MENITGNGKDGDDINDNKIKTSSSGSDSSSLQASSMESDNEAKQGKSFVFTHMFQLFTQN